MQKVRKNNSGFTLIELMVAAFILVVGILSTLELFNYCSYLAEMSGNTNYAINQAQSKIDEMRAASFSTLTTSYASGGTPGNTFTMTNPTGTGVVTIDSTNPDLLQVTIDVTWKNEQSDRNAQLSLITLIARK